jgi:hypothetical protein
MTLEELCDELKTSGYDVWGMPHIKLNYKFYGLMVLAATSKDLFFKEIDRHIPEGFRLHRYYEAGRMFAKIYKTGFIGEMKI